MIFRCLNVQQQHKHLAVNHLRCEMNIFESCFIAITASSSYIIFIGWCCFRQQKCWVGQQKCWVVHISLFLFSLSSNFGTNSISALSSQFLGNFLGWCCFRQQVWILRGRVGPDEENPDNYERVRKKCHNFPNISDAGCWMIWTKLPEKANKWMWSNGPKMPHLWINDI